MQAINQKVNEAVRLGQNAPQPLRDTPPVTVELNELSMAMSRLEATVTGLEQQLEPVMNLGRVPPSAGSTGQAIASICPMGEMLRGLGGRINLIQTQLATMRDAIEI